MIFIDLLYTTSFRCSDCSVGDFVVIWPTCVRHSSTLKWASVETCKESVNQRPTCRLTDCLLSPCSLTFSHYRTCQCIGYTLSLQSNYYIFIYALIYTSTHYRYPSIQKRSRIRTLTAKEKTPWPQYRCSVCLVSRSCSRLSISIQNKRR